MSFPVRAALSSCPLFLDDPNRNGAFLTDGNLHDLQLVAHERQFRCSCLTIIRSDDDQCLHAETVIDEIIKFCSSL